MLSAGGWARHWSELITEKIISESSESLRICEGLLSWLQFPGTDCACIELWSVISKESVLRLGNYRLVASFESLSDTVAELSQWKSEEVFLRIEELQIRLTWNVKPVKPTVKKSRQTKLMGDCCLFEGPTRSWHCFWETACTRTNWQHLVRSPIFYTLYYTAVTAGEMLVLHRPLTRFRLNRIRPPANLEDFF